MNDDLSLEMMGWLSDVLNTSTIQRGDATSGGKNNRGYRIIAHGMSYFLKQYWQSASDARDRKGAEWKFSRYLWDAGVREIPEPIASHTEMPWTLFRWVDGMPFSSETLMTQDVKAASDFFLKINSNTPHHILPPASEACFSLHEHLDCIRQRMERLKAVCRLGDELDIFLSEKLTPVLIQSENKIHKSADSTRVLSEEYRVISPSDFGFHNAMKTISGDVIFHDFEYAGMDDPAKSLCDFFLQPRVPVPRSMMPHCLGRWGKGDPDFEERVKMLRPLYEIKWVTILLNPFLQSGSERRQFAERKAVQRNDILLKAKAFWSAT